MVVHNKRQWDRVLGRCQSHWHIFNKSANTTGLAFLAHRITAIRHSAVVESVSPVRASPLWRCLCWGPAADNAPAIAATLVV